MEKYSLKSIRIKRGLVEREQAQTQKTTVDSNKQLAASQAGFRSNYHKHDNLNSLNCHGKAYPPGAVPHSGLHSNATGRIPADEVTGRLLICCSTQHSATIREVYTVAG